MPSKEALFVAVVQDFQSQSLIAAQAAAASAQQAQASPAHLMACALAARLGLYQAALQGSPHIAELTNEQHRLCGPIVAQQRVAFRQWLIELVAQERDTQHLLLPQTMSNDDFADDALCIAQGVKLMLTDGNTQALQARVERMLGHLIAGMRA
jgi:AcrR family transcriptional regulator